MQLLCQAIHRLGNVVPLRKPAAWKTKGQIGSLDTAFAQVKERAVIVARGQRLIHFLQQLARIVGASGTLG